MSTLRICSKCKKKKPASRFWKDSHTKSGLRFHCIECSSKHKAKWYAKNREQQKQRSATWRKQNIDKARKSVTDSNHRNREAVLSAYGNKCSCCGESHKEFLSLEHLNRDGYKHRKSRGAHGIYRDVIKQGFPKEYTVLCMNCNWAKARTGVCPHESERALSLARGGGE